MEAQLESPREIKVNMAACDEKAQFGELLQHLKTSVETIEKILSKESILYDPSYLDMVRDLKDSKAHLLSVQDKIDHFIMNRPKNRRQTVAQIVANPMIVPTPQAQKFQTVEGRLDLEKMPEDQLYNFFCKATEPVEPMTKDTRKEVELILRQTFSSVPLSVIRRILILNSYQLAQSILHIEAWLQSDIPNEFHWISPTGKGIKCRMIYDYEREDMKKRPRSAQKQDELFKMEMSLSTILDLQYICVKRALIGTKN